jgi:DNA replication protein DnaC
LPGNNAEQSLSYNGRIAGFSRETTFLHIISTSRLAQIFNNDSTLTSAILDRIMHHVDTVIIEGKSFRMKDEVEE